LSGPENDEAERKGNAAKEKECDRALMCPEEWVDPAGRTVIHEYHKEGLPEHMAGIESDLDSFEQYWRKKGAINVNSEYHKEGAPYVERPSNWDGHRPRLGEVPQELAEEKGQLESDRVGKVSASGTDENKRGGSEGIVPTPEKKGTGRPPGRIERPIDLSTLEIITYALFRVVFGGGVRIPIKREGMVDVDITVKGKEVTVNTNQMYFAPPELTVWHIVYMHKGKPVIEFGRGVKKGMKIHRLRALLLVFELWMGSRRGRPIQALPLVEYDGVKSRETETDER